MATNTKNFMDVITAATKPSTKSLVTQTLPTSSTAGWLTTINNAVNKAQQTINNAVSTAKATGDYSKLVTPAQPKSNPYANNVTPFTPLQSYNTDFNNLLSGATSGLQSQYNTAVAATAARDLSDIINSWNATSADIIKGYQDTLAAQTKTRQTEAQQKRNDLLTSLKRFQESNAQDKLMQQQDYTAARANLEDETFMNQRNAMANAAARGLGGSGLQQLAQLQNRIAAGKQVSTLANKNQTEQDKLRKALIQAQEDYDTKTSDIETTLANVLAELQASTNEKIAAEKSSNTDKINDLKYKEYVRQQEAAQEAARLAASISSSRASNTANYNKGISALTNLQNSVSYSLQNAANDAERQDILNTALLTLNTAGGEYNPATYGLYDNSYLTTATNNLRTLYNRYK